MSTLEQCSTLSCDIVGIVITFLQLGQFIPQHWEMAVDQSIVGVSPWLLFFNSLYTYLVALDVLLLDGTSVWSCHQHPYRCFINDQPVIQMVGSAALCISMWYWYLKYYHTADQVHDPAELRLMQSTFYLNLNPTHVFNSFLAIAAAFTAYSCAIILTYGQDSSFVHAFAHFCGLLSAVLNAVMWIPQIFLTAAYQHRGALSIGWVFASVVMDLVYSLYLAAVGQHWTIWANNVPDGIQTSILLVMLLRIEYVDHRKGLDGFGRAILPSSDERPPDETTPLTKPSARLNRQLDV